MKPKTMILVAVAVVCGLAASYLTSRLLAERTGSDPGEKVTIVVARKNLATGAIIETPTDMFQEKLVTKGDEPTHALTRFDELKGKVIKRSLREGDFVSADDLLTDKNSIMAYLLPPGHQAYGLKVSIQEIAGGFASLPLSKVDIYATIRRDTDKSFSKRLLQDVLVLAADQKFEREERGALPATTVTLALTPEDIQKVSLVKEFGTLSLALRKFDENQKTDLPSFSIEDWLNDGKNKPLEVVAEEPVEKIPVHIEPPARLLPSNKKHVVITYNGSLLELTEFTLDENDEVISSRIIRREEMGPGQPVLTPPPAPAPPTPALPPAP